MADVGRPLMYQTPQEMQIAIDSYFDSCEEEVWYSVRDDKGVVTWHPSKDRHGNIEKRLIKPYTVSGLAIHLGTNRTTLMNYEDKEEFVNTIKNAKARIEGYAEESLFTNGKTAGVIFNLKNNFGWTDKQEVDQTVSGKDGAPLQVTFSPGMKKNE